MTSLVGQGICPWQIGRKIASAVTTNLVERRGAGPTRVILAFPSSAVRSTTRMSISLSRVIEPFAADPNKTILSGLDDTQNPANDFFQYRFIDVHSYHSSYSYRM
jgi:hypothetical protein